MYLKKYILNKRKRNTKLTNMRARKLQMTYLNMNKSDMHAILSTYLFSIKIRDKVAVSITMHLTHTFCYLTIVKYYSNEDSLTDTNPHIIANM